jgi:hypothetical protein
MASIAEQSQCTAKCDANGESRQYCALKFTQSDFSTFYCIATSRSCENLVARTLALLYLYLRQTSILSVVAMEPLSMTMQFVDGFLAAILPSMFVVAWLVWRASVTEADRSL